MRQDSAADSGGSQRLSNVCSQTPFAGWSLACSVMEGRLEGQEWLAGGRYTVADIACFPWVLMHDLWGGWRSGYNAPIVQGWPR